MKSDTRKKIVLGAVAVALAAGTAVPLITQALADEPAAAQIDNAQLEKAEPEKAQAEKAQPEDAQPAAAQDAGDAEKKVAPDTVVLTIGEEKITAAQFEEFLSGLPPQYQQMAEQDPAARRMIADELVKIRLLANEARKRGLEKTSKVQTQLRMIEDQVLAGALAGTVIEDKDIQAHIDKNKANYEKVKARHILIRTPDSPVPPGEGQKTLTDEQAKAKAQDIRKRVAAGEDFAEIAKKESDDKGSGAQGGDLGTFGHGQMVPEFEKAAFSLKKGEISEPVKTQFGYHVIQVQEVVGATFDEVKAQVTRELGPQRMEALVAELRAKAETDLNTDYFGAPPAPPAEEASDETPAAEPADAAAKPKKSAAQPKKEAPQEGSKK